MAPHQHQLQTEELTIEVGDNSPVDTIGPNGQQLHLAGYNGLWSLKSVHDPHSLFLPGAGPSYSSVCCTMVECLQQFEQQHAYLP